MILFLALIPLFAAASVLVTPKEGLGRLRALVMVGCFLPFLITLSYLFRFDPAMSGFQFVERITWLPALGIHYQAGFDGINLTLCLLHALVSLAGAAVSCSVKERLKEYLFFYLLLTGAIYGVFTSLNLFFLYVFYEMTLIPLYPMIGIWGSNPSIGLGWNKQYAAMKLTIFITAGAALALFGLLMLYREIGARSFDLSELKHTVAYDPLSIAAQKWIAPFLLIGFGVIASLWPFHSWSPIGYAAAPTSVSMLHAGVLKKMGPYLILRIAVAFLPSGVLAHAPWLAALATIGILYAGYAAMRQKDLKFMVGFSSVSHMGYVLLGIAAMTVPSVSGAVLLMFSHGVMAAAAFALIGFIYETTHTRGMDDFGGLAKTTPFWTFSFIAACLASLGLPGFSNFAAELLIFIGAWPSVPFAVGLAVFGILITAIYLLRAVQKICYGPPNPAVHGLRDLSGIFEKFPIVMLLGALLLFGFWPRGLLRIIQPSVEALLK